jgi:hypothetical protein
MLKHSIRLVIHYLKFWDVPVPYPSYHFNRALAEANQVAKTSLDSTYHTSIQQRLSFTVIVQLVLAETKDFLANSDLQGRVESGNDSPPRISLIVNRTLSVTTFLQAQPITTAKAPIL